MGRVLRPYDRESVLACFRPAPVEEQGARMLQLNEEDTDAEYWENLVNGEEKHQQSLAELAAYNKARAAAEPRYIPPPISVRETKRARQGGVGGGAAPQGGGGGGGGGAAPQGGGGGGGAAPQGGGGGGPQGGGIVNNNNPPANPRMQKGLVDPYAFDLSAVAVPTVSVEVLEFTNEQEFLMLRSIREHPKTADPRDVQNLAYFINVRLAGTGKFDGTAANNILIKDFGLFTIATTDTGVLSDAEWNARKAVYQTMFAIAFESLSYGITTDRQNEMIQDLLRSADAYIKATGWGTAAP